MADGLATTTTQPEPKSPDFSGIEGHQAVKPAPTVDQAEPIDPETGLSVSQLQPFDFSSIKGHQQVKPAAVAQQPEEHPVWQRVKDFNSMRSDDYLKKYAADDAATHEKIQNFVHKVIPFSKEADELQAEIEKTKIGKQAGEFVTEQLQHPEQFVASGEFGALGAVESEGAGAVRGALEKGAKSLKKAFNFDSIPAHTEVRPAKSAPSFDDIPGHVTVNASGESSASAEAISRTASEKAKSIKTFRVDTRSGREVPVFGVDAADSQPSHPYEKIIRRESDGHETILSAGTKAR